MTGIYADPSSSAYKKAQRHYIKSSQTSPSANQSPFRVQEKLYKTRFPRPSLGRVLDIPISPLPEPIPVESLDELEEAGWGHGYSDSDVAESIPTRTGESSSQAYRIRSIPGLVVIPRFLSTREERELIRSALEDQSRHPNETNLDAHYIIPDSGLWPIWERAWRRSVSSNANSESQRLAADDLLISPKPSPTSNESQLSATPSKRELVENPPASTKAFDAIVSTPKIPPTPSSSLSPTPVSRLLYKMRWANLGRSYHWGTKSYDFSKKLAPFPSNVRDICKRAVEAVDWAKVWKGEVVDEHEWGEEGVNWDTWAEDYEPDAGIVNFYQASDTLMGHVDRSELSAVTPLVSISLGNAAIFLIGGLTRDVDPIPILLRSGDVVIMSGPRCRRAYHGVPRILEGTLPKRLRTDEASRDERNAEWAPFAAYMNTTRININVRQVFPKGFVPPDTLSS